MTEHNCDWCPNDVRNLYAVAHNAHGAVERALTGMGDWSRARRKLAELGEVLDEIRPLVDAHFKSTLPPRGCGDVVLRLPNG